MTPKRTYGQLHVSLAENHPSIQCPPSHNFRIARNPRRGYHPTLMDSPPAPRQPDAVRPAAEHPAWLLVLLALMAYQAWMTLGLFGRERPWERLRDGEPVVSGRHPLHLYHGYLGARSALLARTAIHVVPAIPSTSAAATAAMAIAGPR